MSKTNGKRTATKGSNAKASQQKQAPAFAARYIAIDSHLIDRNGSTDQVFGIAGERPAGRKLAKDIANACNQLHAEGYDILNMLPIVSGRIVEATVEAEVEVKGRTYRKLDNTKPEQNPNSFYTVPGIPQAEYKYYVDTGAGYSVTDGVVIMARLRS